jgi:alpha-tubulin suppressor-like RCC1 family protein
MSFSMSQPCLEHCALVNGTLYAAVNNLNSLVVMPLPVQVTGLTSGVSKIVCGDYFSCAVVTPGALSCWGSNAYGQLGDGTFIDKYVPTPVMNMSSDVTYASAGSAHMCAIKSSTVWCWGSNILAALGQGTCCGAPSSVPLPVSLGGLNATAVAAGAAHTCALRTDGSAFCWGR